MTDLKLFQLDADGRDIELRGSTVALEVELQRRIEAGMEAMSASASWRPSTRQGPGTGAESTRSGSTRTTRPS